jgi:hypothetical protein
MSIAGVARWELNQRPHRKWLERLLHLAASHDFQDLAKVFYDTHQQVFGLSSYDRTFATEAANDLAGVIAILDGLPNPKDKLSRAAKQHARQVLERLKTKLTQFPPERTDPADADTSEPTEPTKEQHE